jgi:hypothetical protein
MISKVIEEKKDSSYLETDMKKREKNNEKARKDMEKMGSMKNPAFEEVSTLRKGWTEAYGSVYEKKMDPVGQEDGDIDNDGDKDSSDKYLAKRRKAIAKSMGKDMKEGKMSDEDVKKRVGYTSDETRQKRLDKIKVKFMNKEMTERVEVGRVRGGEMGAIQNKQNAQRDASNAAGARGPEMTHAAKMNNLKRSMPTNMRNSYEPEGEMVVDEGYKELSRDKRNKMFRKAGNLSRTALQGGDKGTEAGKKSGKIVKALNKDAEMNNRNDVKNEEVTFSEAELEAIQTKVDEWNVENEITEFVAAPAGSPIDRHSRGISKYDKRSERQIRMDNFASKRTKMLNQPKTP